MKQINANQITDFVKDGMTVMIGGFMSVGTPQKIMDALVSAGVKNLTVISNDAGTPGNGIGKLVDAGVISKMMTTHIGMNPEAGRKMNEGSIDITLVPQGTLAEQIRAAGAGLGGVLTPTGLGTSVADGKRIVEIEGKQFLLELPVKADVALLYGSAVDMAGNVFYLGTTRNFNPLMAMAADVVIAEAGEIVEIGKIQPECVMTPGIFVDYVVGGGSDV